MYLRLNNYIHLVSGEYSTLYDVNNNTAYLLDKLASEFICHCENNKEMEEWKQYEENSDKIKIFIDTLKTKKLALIFKERLFIDKFENHSKLNKRFLFVPQYSKIFLQITSICNSSCFFCKNDNFSVWGACNSCHIMSQAEQSIDEILLDNIINELCLLDLNEIVIKGGNPFICIDLLKYCIQQINSKKSNIQITIVWNGTLANLSIIKELLEIHNNIKFQVVLFSLRNETNYSFPEFNEQKRLIQSLINNSIEIGITIYSINHFEDETFQFCKRLNLTPIYANVIDMQKIDNNNKQKLIMPTINSTDYFLRKKYNSCLFGSFYISSSGDVKPCCQISDSIGNLHDNTLQRVLSNYKLYDYWFLTKDKVEICKECGMRFLCKDCTAFELDEINHNIYCPYNTGKDKDEDKMKIICMEENFINQISI